MSEQKFTVRDLRRLHSALTILGNRFAPTLNADIKVSKFLGPITKALEPYEKSKSKVFIRVAEANGVSLKDTEKMSGIAQQLLLAKVAEAQEAAEAEEVTVVLPETKLNRDDLPKERSGEEGWQNGSQLGAIISDLGELFEYPKE